VLITALLDEYISVCIFNGYTSAHIRSITDIFIKRSGCLLVSDVNLEKIAIYKDATLKCCKPITFNTSVKYLRMLFKYALECGYVSENIFQRIRLAKVGQPQPKVYSDRQIQELRQALLSSTLEPVWFWITVVETLHYTGIRRRQLISLRLGDIDFEQCSIYLQYDGSKTKKTWKIPLHPKLAEILKEYLIKLKSECGRTLQKHEYLFSVSRINPAYKNYGSGKMSPEQVTGFFKRLSKKTSFTTGAHRFRHTLATTLCNPPNGSPDIFSVQEILGHADLKTTKSYVMPNFSRLAATLKLLP
jgi:site-specific recombinase XerD